ncbi:MAG: RicAFT regulatory complex protein RicA family protein [Hydrogenibacillus schlegelii]|nr:RicAFT regulatory complex protein RicA family protein [Hydrogenibacillus schlegelii]
MSQGPAPVGARRFPLRSREEILAKARELADFIAQSEEVRFYQLSEQKIKANGRVSSLIAEIKRKQKEAVNAEHLGKKAYLEQVEAEIRALEAELDAIPIVQEFKAAQTEVNDLLQLITTTIANAVTDRIIEDTGGDVLSGQSGRLPPDDVAALEAALRERDRIG